MVVSFFFFISVRRNSNFIYREHVTLSIYDIIDSTALTHENPLRISLHFPLLLNTNSFSAVGTNNRYHAAILPDWWLT
uniref:Uncharacterized protein n=1 Tax=Octopus bimaculoides TaxID=37653 RepID=A0A0L8GDY9_OCTBM